MRWFLRLPGSLRYMFIVSALVLVVAIVEIARGDLFGWIVAGILLVYMPLIVLSARARSQGGESGYLPPDRDREWPGVNKANGARPVDVERPAEPPALPPDAH